MSSAPATWISGRGRGGPIPVLLLAVLLLLSGATLGWSRGPAPDPTRSPLEVRAGSVLGSSLGGELLPDSLVRPSHVPGIEAAEVLAPESDALRDRVRVVYWPEHRARAERVVATVERHALLPGIPEAHPTRAFIFLTPDDARWDALTGGRTPHWGAGVAIPALDRIVLPVHRTPWDGFHAEARTVRHEWAHLGLHDYLRGLRIPRWFDEGYAQWSSGGWNVEEAWRLRLQLATGSAPPLDSLSLSWPRARAEAEIAYLLAASAMEYLVSGSGTRGVEVFLARWREGGDFEEAFRATFGITTGTFERQWTEHVKRRYGFLLVLGQSTLFWLFLGAALLGLWRIRRKRDRERMERLRASEVPELPAWWDPPQAPPVGGFPGERRPDPPEGAAGEPSLESEGHATGALEDGDTEDPSVDRTLVDRYPSTDSEPEEQDGSGPARLHTARESKHESTKA